MKPISLIYCYIVLVFFAMPSYAQMPDHIYDANIKTPLLFKIGNEFDLPVINLNSRDKLELHFDDLDPGYKNYYYCFQLCNADWSRSNLNQMEFFKGFNSSRISSYRNSSVALVKYVHYQATIPENNSLPIKSGNYLLKVYKDNDTSKLAFTKRIFVVENKVAFGVNFMAPFNGNNVNTMQKMLFNLNYNNLNLTDVYTQLKVKVIPNNSFLETRNMPPTFLRQNSIEYSNEADILFTGGNEWRYLDMRSLRFKSDRIETINSTVTPNIVNLRADVNRNKYIYYIDINGGQTTQLLETINPYWQGEYAQVNFKYTPPNMRAINYGDVYVFGAFNNYEISEANKMSFNPSTGNYEHSQLLKQGFYNYRYVIVDSKGNFDISSTEGNFANTENNYTLLAYYRSYSGRHDELIGFNNINTFNFSFFRTNFPRLNPLQIR